jgi:cytochrome c556
MIAMTRLFAAGLVTVVGIGIAYAQFSKPEDAIAYRQAAMQIIGHHFGLLGAVVKGEQPYSKDAVVRNAQVVSMVAELPWEASLVPESYGKGTRLLEKAMNEKEDFLAAAGEFEAAAKALAAAAESGDADAIKGPVGETAKSCKACHSEYRGN